MSANALSALTERARSWGASLRDGLHSPPDQSDPSAPLFRRIRRDMTLLYSAVLMATLLIAGLIIYVATQQVVLASPHDSASHTAHELAQFWEQTGISPCQVEQGGLPLEYACYDAQGKLIAQSRRAALDPNFSAPNLARQVLRGGSSSDQVGAVSDQSAMLRVAVIAYSPIDNTVLGVVQVGIPIAGYLIALRTLSVVLILVGAFTLLVAALGGFALSARSLLPARLAYGRQQRFIADVSHELRTPLTLLRADAEVLLRGSERLPEDDVEILENIVAETAHLANLTNSLLTMARLDSGTLHAERDVVDFTEVAGNVASRARPFAEERGITLRTETSPDAIVLGAPELLEQATMILVDNAIKYNAHGGSVTVRSERKGSMVYVTIQDTGIGIAAEHLPHLGERFYRPDKARSRQEGGAGLGLSIARRIAEMHGGTLTLESTPGQGTLATITLPALEARARAEATP